MDIGTLLVKTLSATESGAGALITAGSGVCEYWWMHGNELARYAINEQFSSFFHQDCVSLDQVMLSILSLAALQGVAAACDGAARLLSDRGISYYLRSSDEAQKSMNLV